MKIRLKSCVWWRFCFAETSANFRFFHFFHENVFIFDIFSICRKISIKLKFFISWYNVWFKSGVDHPPREWVGTSQVFRAQPRGYHWIFVPNPRDYHWIFVPDPGAITGYLFPTLGAITGYLFPTLGISPIFPLKKWYARGGMVNHRFEPHINVVNRSFYNIYNFLNILCTVFNSVNPKGPGGGGFCVPIGEKTCKFSKIPAIRSTTYMK